ncbi:MAG: hypothetical protein SGI88_00380 [Candidatus Hydrogenedentes bacterium]|nr:hypothetical protein [Candidatus Hydrogenedentota bacterium]
MFRRAKKTAITKIVDDTTVAHALAKAVSEGDFVNFRLLFQPFSPARPDSSELFDDEKYAYLLPDPDTESDGEFKKAVAAVRDAPVWAHVQRELSERRPAQLPSELVLLLADNAVRLGKYTIAAQAYELLRIRRRMQDEFFALADKALDEGKTARGVHGYIVATGLDYNYAAFPEPLPLVPDWQTRALIVHGEYPVSPENCLPLQPTEVFLRNALAYLLLGASSAARLESRPLEVRLAVLAELVKQRDPEWREFVGRYREACKLMHDYETRIQHAVAARGDSRISLAREIEEVLGADPREIPATLLGRTIEDGEWWQYLKELAFEHPAAALFVSRQIIGDAEIIVPRYRGDSPVTPAVGLLPATAFQPAGSSIDV